MDNTEGTQRGPFTLGSADSYWEEPLPHIRQQQRDWTVSKAFLKIRVIGLFTESGEDALISDGFLLSKFWGENPTPSLQRAKTGAHHGDSKARGERSGEVEGQRGEEKLRRRKKERYEEEE